MSALKPICAVGWHSCLACFVLLVHCNRPSESKSAETVGANGSRSRHPAVAFDPPGYKPELSDATSDNTALVALAQPEPVFAALAVTQRFFQAIVAEDTASLAALLTSDAEQTPSARRQRAKALDYWTRRLQLLEYQDLSPSLIYSEAAISVVRGSAAEASPVEPDQPLPLRPGELLLCVPISALAQGTGRFGPVIELALSQLTGDYKIRVIREDFDLPPAP